MYKNNWRLKIFCMNLTTENDKSHKIDWEERCKIKSNDNLNAMQKISWGQKGNQKFMKKLHNCVIHISFCIEYYKNFIAFPFYKNENAPLQAGEILKEKMTFSSSFRLYFLTFHFSIFYGFSSIFHTDISQQVELSLKVLGSYKSGMHNLFKIRSQKKKKCWCQGPNQRVSIKTYYKCENTFFFFL